MSQIQILVAQFGKVAFVQGIFLVALGYGFQVQQSGLPHEDGFYLEQVVAVLAHGLQGDVTSPLLEGVAVDAEPVVAGQRREVGFFPRTASLTDPLLDGYGLLLQAFCLQGCHP